MRKIMIAGLVLTGSVLMANIGWCLNWIDRVSFRVETLGGAGLAIEDETTSLGLINHFNPAGLALELEHSRIDWGETMGVNYHSSEDAEMLSEATNLRKYSYTEVVSNTGQTGGPLQGLTLQLPYSMVLRLGVDYSTDAQNMTTEYITYSSSEKSEDSFDAPLGNLDIQLAWQTPFGLALGGQLKYDWATLTYGKLNENHNFIYGGQTTNYKISSDNLAWSGGIGQELRLNQNHRILLGAYAARDNVSPSLANVDSGGKFYSAGYTGDFNTSIEISGYSGYFGDITEKADYASSPLLVGIEAVYKLNSLMEAGLYFDYKYRKIKFTDERNTNGEETKIEFDANESNQTAVTPMVRFNIPLGDISLLPAVRFTTTGTGENKDYEWDNFLNDRYVSRKSTTVGNNASLAIGLQAWEKRFQAGVQCDTVTEKDETKYYSSNGNNTDTYQSDIGIVNAREGVEFWLSKSMALRAGSVISYYTDKLNYTSTL